MHKRFSKALAFALALLMVLAVVPGAAFAAPVAELPDEPAAGQKYDIVLTKVKAGETWPEFAGYDGSQWSGTLQTLSGVYFKLYKVEATTLDAAALEIAGKTPLKEGATDDNGVINFQGLDAGNYYIVEDETLSKIPEGEVLADQKAVPALITLPVYKAEGGYFTTLEDSNALYIYPKNTVDKPTAEKDVTEIGNKHDTVDFGEPIEWIITATIPKGIEDYKVYRFTDKLSKLDFVASPEGWTTPVDCGFVTEVAEGENVAYEYTPFTDTTGYTVTTPSDSNDQTLTVDFVKGGACYFTADDVGKMIYIKFQTTLNEESVIMGADTDNGILFEYGTNPDNAEEQTPDKPEVHTGGKRFIKKDAEGKLLSEAVFVVLRKNPDADPQPDKADQVLAVVNNKYTWLPRPANDDFSGDEYKDVLYLHSDTNGEFEIKGLSYGDKKTENGTGSTEYWLKETAAPEGYAKLREDIPFTVNKGSYADDTGAIQYQDVLNNKITIPETGGIGSLAVVALGALVIGAGVALLKKRHPQESND